MKRTKNLTAAYLAALIFIPPAIVAFWMGVSSCDPVYPGDSKPLKILPEIVYYSVFQDCIDAAQLYAPIEVHVEVRDASGKEYDKLRYYNWDGFDPIEARVPSNGKFKIFIKVFGRCHDCCSARWYPDGQPIYFGGKAHDESADEVQDVHVIPIKFEGCQKCTRV